MAIVNRSFSVSVTPGAMPPIIHVSEYDIGRSYTVAINGENGEAFTIPTGATASIEGTLNGTVGFTTSATISNNQITFALTESMTAYSGKAWCKIKLTLNSEPIQTCAFILAVDRAGVEADTVIGADGFEEQIENAVADYLNDFAIDDEVVRDAVDDYLDENGVNPESIAPLVTEWLTDNVDPVGSAVVVDSSLSVEGAAADAAATGAIKNYVGVLPEFEPVFDAEESENVDIIINQKLGSSGFVPLENFNPSTGVPGTVSSGARTIIFPVKPGSTIHTLKNQGMVLFDDRKNYVSGFAVNISDRDTVIPDGVYYAGISSNTSNFSPSGSYYFQAKTNCWVRNISFTSDNFDPKVDETVSVAGKAPDARKVADKLNAKLEVEYVYEGVSSSEPNLSWNPQNGTKYIKQEDLLIGKTVNSKGEVIDGTDETTAITRMFPVKPESVFYTYGTSFVLYFYDKAGNYLSRVGGTGYAYITTTVPANAFYVRFFGLTDNLDGAIEQVKRIQSNYIPTKVYPKSDSLHVDFENIDNLTLQSVIFEGEPSRRLQSMAIQQANKMRHAWRVASFNTYGTGGAGNRNWTAIKELLQEFGIDMIGFQEVNTPLSPNSDGKTFEQALTSWQLSQFGIIQTEAVPTNCRPVATTGEFEVVSITETKYTTQSNYGNRYYTRTEVKLPRWKDKKASENFKVSIYNTQLEVGTSAANNNTRLAQAAQLIAAMNADTNPFIILVGDFNEMSVGWDTVNAFKNAGYTPQLEDTSTPTAGRGFYDFIFVNERISFLENEVVPYDLHHYYPGGVQANISDHDLVFADVVFDYENLISVKTSLPNCTLSGGGYWLDRRQTEPVVYTVTADEGYTVQSISTGQGDNDLTYNNGAVVLSGNTVTIKPNLVVGDVWINVTTAAAS